MQTIDITTALGISAIVGVLIQILKQGINKTTIKDKFKKIIIIILVIAFCLLFSWIAYFGGIVENDTIQSMLIRALQASFITIGGYEGIKQLINLFTAEK